MFIDILKSQRQTARDPGLFHGDAIKDVSHCHSWLTVSDHDELRILLKLTQNVDESSNVRVVQGRIHFVQNTERTRSTFEDGQQERHCSQRSFATAQQRNAAEFFAGRSGHDID